MAARRTLVIAGDADRHAALSAAARQAGHAVEPAQSPAEARAALTDPAVDTLLLDLRIPTLDRSRLLEALDPADGAPPDTLDDAERRHIARALAHTGGNRRQAAILLGIARSTLLFKLRRYGLDGG